LGFGFLGFGFGPQPPIPNPQSPKKIVSLISKNYNKLI